MRPSLPLYPGTSLWGVGIRHLSPNMLGTLIGSSKPPLNNKPSRHQIQHGVLVLRRVIPFKDEVLGIPHTSQEAHHPKNLYYPFAPPGLLQIFTTRHLFGMVMKSRQLGCFDAMLGCYLLLCGTVE